jgi:hypothetical protein
MDEFKPGQSRAIQSLRGKLGPFLCYSAATAFIPFSSGGLTPEIWAKIYPNRGSGILAEHPERVLVMGMIYFGCLGLAELWLG